jgi:hypothetical protein
MQRLARGKRNLLARHGKVVTLDVITQAAVPTMPYFNQPDISRKEKREWNRLGVSELSQNITDTLPETKRLHAAFGQIHLFPPARLRSDSCRNLRMRIVSGVTPPVRHLQ